MAAPKFELIVRIVDEDKILQETKVRMVPQWTPTAPQELTPVTTSSELIQAVAGVLIESMQKAVPGLVTRTIEAFQSGLRLVSEDLPKDETE